MFSISCLGIMVPQKNCWPSDCDVSFDQAKHEIFLDLSQPIPSQLGPKNLPFETRVIAHIVATTLLPRASSHSMLTQRDTLFAYCLVFDVKVHLSFFIISSMTDVISDPSSLPFGMLITHIFESHFMCLGDFAPVLIKQRYNSHAFLSMGFTRSGSSILIRMTCCYPVKFKPSSSTFVSTTKLNAALEILPEMHIKLDAMAITVAQVNDLMTKLSAMSKQVDFLKDLLLLDQIVKEAIKIATKVQAGSKAISTSPSSIFEKMLNDIVNTLTYFLHPH
ncbi:hypothetical protein H5410_050998 [Solanum commersonii]|uniref:Uncharacterized protein n=1 Tax=Solanum commersonii TaxID=4109 RepID=A0A9J5WX47_SOLCO|nr:hypothetical protein H5410_050998 [Solanum commersonii]